ncbi:hypothetical protein ACWGIP_11265, partial [Streptomyces sp. NPDC054838]
FTAAIVAAARPGTRTAEHVDAGPGPGAGGGGNHPRLTASRATTHTARAYLAGTDGGKPAL